MKNNFFNFLQTSSLQDQQKFVRTKKILCMSSWILRFKNGYNEVVIELRVKQFWSAIILMISNQTCAAYLFDFKFTFVISV